MRQTRYVFVRGKAKWCRLINPDTSFDSKGKWNMVLYPDDKSWTEILELKKEGIRNVLKRDEDGNYTQFSRNTMKKIKGSEIPMLPPEIIDKDGNPLRNVIIGNGSDVIVKLEVYYFHPPAQPKTETGTAAARIMTVRVDNLVPYTKESYDAKTQKAVKGMDQQPEMLF